MSECSLTLSSLINSTHCTDYDSILFSFRCARYLTQLNLSSDARSVLLRFILLLYSFLLPSCCSTELYCFRLCFVAEFFSTLRPSLFSLVFFLFSPLTALTEFYYALSFLQSTQDKTTTTRREKKKRTEKLYKCEREYTHNRADNVQFAIGL